MTHHYSGDGIYHFGGCLLKWAYFTLAMLALAIVIALGSYTLIWWVYRVTTGDLS